VAGRVGLPGARVKRDLAAYMRRWRGCEPPPGYVRVTEYARAHHYSEHTIHYWIEQGWEAARLWRSPGGHRYVPADAPEWRRG
jgi:hypothetical protein